jgi:hypothetical protein
LRKINKDTPETIREMRQARGKPHHALSMPLIRFMPNKLAIKVGNMSMME